MSTGHGASACTVIKAEVKVKVSHSLMAVLAVRARTHCIFDTEYERRSLSLSFLLPSKALYINLLLTEISEWGVERGSSSLLAPYPLACIASLKFGKLGIVL